MKTLHLFEAFGLELEYMLVNRESLNLVPLADALLDETGEKNNGSIAWSNELALHVLELKTNGPTRNLRQSAQDFYLNVQFINAQLEKLDACLLSGAAHPWMDPDSAKLWPHECNEIYCAYDRIFNCKGHGWVNLQSTHLNLPFADDEEFRKLHTAIRLILPLLPALSASSPFMEGKPTGLVDTRLFYYNTNQKAIPHISGHVIPERVRSKAEYEKFVLEPSFQAIESHDPDKLLQHEWLNSRGAIARFSRMAIEIRILDIQENPFMDVAIVALIVEVLKKLVDEDWASFEVQWSFDEKHLATLYQDAIRLGGEAVVNDLPYLEIFGVEHPIRMRDLWQKIDEKLGKVLDPYRTELNVILKEGSLAERMLETYEKNPTKDTIFSIYQSLRDCLLKGVPYRA